MKLKTILDNIQFKPIKKCNFKEIKIIRQIRNEDKIRKKMRTKHRISISEHLVWFDKIKHSKKNFFYVIKYQDHIVGGLGLKNLNKKLLFGEWSFYISSKKNFIGLGASIEYKAIEFFFKTLKLRNGIVMF